MNKINSLTVIGPESMQKFTSEGIARSFPGLSLVHFIHPRTLLFKKLVSYTEQLKLEFMRHKIADKFVFLPAETFHITILDIMLKPNIIHQSQVIRETGISMQRFQNAIAASPVYELEGYPSVSHNQTLILRANAQDNESRNTITSIRNTVHHSLTENVSKTAITRHHEFHAHLTIAYILKPFSEEEFTLYQLIMKRYAYLKNLGALTISTIELRRFETMENWGTSALLKFDI